MRIPLVWSLLLCLSACTPRGTTADPANDAELTTCERHEDCVLVNLECCDDCLDGKVWSVRAAAAATVKEREGRACGEDEVCGDRLCGGPEPRAHCQQGTCVTWRGDAYEYNER